MDAAELIQTVGFPIASVIACASFLYSLVIRYMNESKDREAKMLEQNSKQLEALQRVASTIEEGNNVNEKLAETNKILVDRIDNQLSGINNNIDKILDKLNQ